MIRLNKKRRNILFTILFLAITPVLIYFVSNAQNSFDSRSQAGKTGDKNICSLPESKQSTLSEYEKLGELTLVGY